MVHISNNNDIYFQRTIALLFLTLTTSIIISLFKLTILSIISWGLFFTLIQLALYFKLRQHQNKQFSMLYHELVYKTQQEYERKKKNGETKNKRAI